MSSRTSSFLMAALLLASSVLCPAQEPKAPAPKAPKSQVKPKVPASPFFGTPANPAAPPVSAKVPLPSRKKPKKMAYAERTDINNASKEAVLKLPGFSEELATKLIAGRPYKIKTDLVTKNIVSGALYFSIKDRVRTETPGKPAVTQSPAKK